ncbi:MAG: hypothetical protein ACR2JY_24255 [Chloroflexota bacterium]
MAIASQPAATQPATPPKPSASTWPGDLIFALSLGVTMRLAYWLYGWWRLRAMVQPYNPFFHGDWENLAPAVNSPSYPWLGPWMHLDALWYKHIAIAGYQPGDGSVHFPPLFPLLAHLTLPLFGGSFGFAAMFVNLMAMIVSFALLRRLAALDGPAEIGSRAAFYMCAFPVGFFLFAPFTEATFLVFTVASLYCARRGYWWWAGIWGFIATTARWQGALLAPALLVEYALQWRAGKRRLGLNIVAIPLPGVAYILYTLYVRYVVGEPRSMTQVNDYWGIKWLPPWDVLQLGWQHIIAGDGLELLNLVAIIGLAVGCLVGLRYLRLSYVVYMAAQWLFIVAHLSSVSPLAASARYILTIFPLFLLLGRAGAHPRLHQAIVIFFFLLQGIFIWQFVVGEWVA